MGLDRQRFLPALVLLGCLGALSACQTAPQAPVASAAAPAQDPAALDPAGSDDEDLNVPHDAPGELAKGIMQSLGAIPAPPPRRSQAMVARPPLVVPKDLARLPQPASGNVYGMAQGFPVDHDVAEARRLRAEAAQASANGDRNVSPQQLAAIQQALSEGRDISEERAKEIAAAKKLTPAEQVQLMQALKMREFYDANGNPVRTALQNPPQDYLAPVPGAPVTTEEPESIKAAKRKVSIFGDWFKW